MAENLGLDLAAFEALSEGIVVQAMDCAIVAANPAACRILGMTVDQMSGRTSLDPRWRAIHEDGSDFPGKDHPSMGVIATGEPAHDVIMGVHTPDDELHWISINVEPTKAEGVQTGIVCTFRDITVERALRARLAESEQMYRLLAENSADVIVRIDHGIIQWASPSLTTVLGWMPDEWEGRSPLALVHPSDTEELLRSDELIRQGKAVVTRCRLQLRDGGYRWVEGHGRAFLDADGRARGMLTTLRDVEVEMRAQAYEHRARHDALTGLLNRDEMMMRLRDVVESPMDTERLTAVAFCDLDGFKEVNDRFGHRSGDDVLTALASRLSARVRESDHAGRIGGDELLVILHGLRDVGAAEHIAKAICEALRQPVPTEQGAVQATVSIGVAIARAGDQVEGLLARADAAMYEAKRQGRDRVVVDPS